MRSINNLIQVLQKANIDFVIVGGYSAVLHGSSMVTQDLDICIRFDASIVLNLRQALASYHPVHRMTPQKLSFLDYPHEIKNIKNIYLETDLGILDILGFVGGVGTFEDVKKNALRIDFFGRPCFLLSIDDLIRAKKYMGRPKDFMVLKELECITAKEKTVKMGVKEIAINNSILRIKISDITEEIADAIVNAANSSLRGGGGVDGAIHRKGGPEIFAECKKITGGCPTGEARITCAGKLKAKFVIHTVGPVWQGGKEGEDELLKKCYYNSLTLAKEHRAFRIAFPAISTGVYGFPKDRAATIALETIKNFLAEEEEHYAITIVLFDEKSYSVYNNIL